MKILPYVVLVLLHHFVLAPLLRKQKSLYFIFTASLLVAFGFYCFHFIPRPRPEMSPGPPPPEFRPEHEPMPPGRGPMRPQTMEMIMGILLIAGDLGLIAAVRMKQNEKRLHKLQNESLKQQIESLRYQINPHFFMNTLNNIQSLILTDPDKATEAVSEFSKLMRIVLYEGNEPTIPLSRELEYLRHYLSLMRMRYPDSVTIEALLPEDTAGAVVPPLLMASFVENAFKHGIRYEKVSYVKISIGLTRSRVVFNCANSRHDSQQTEQHGLGMDNVKKRLSLLYASDFALQISESSDTYNILLDIPSAPSTSA